MTSRPSPLPAPTEAVFKPQGIDAIGLDNIAEFWNSKSPALRRLALECADADRRKWAEDTAKENNDERDSH